MIPKYFWRTGAITVLLAASIYTVKAQSNLGFVVKANELKAPIQPTMWGVFFEDINMGADGGLYAEMVKNRSFEFPKALMGWAILGNTTAVTFTVADKHISNSANPHFLQVKLNHAANKTVGISNEGFRGMGIKQGLRYDFSVMYHQTATEVKWHIALVDSAGESLGGTILMTNATNDAWLKQAISFKATATQPKAKLNIWLEGDGGVDLDMVSLFPEDTWKKRPGGLRADMVQMLSDMKPGFIRFPGGCIVEGRNLDNRYQWKKTVGAVEERPLLMNRWNVEMKAHQTPDYFQTFGLGFFEYFQLAEDVGAEPLPIINCGMACQFNTGELATMNELEPYLRDALDLIEFANGDTTTQWGKVRASMGHPKPFNLKMMGIGNENWGDDYIQRVPVFAKAIKEKYPRMKIVNSSGTDPDGQRFDLLNKQLRVYNADFIDEHYYRKPEWFLKNVTRYDKYPRTTTRSRVFAGEYAAHSDEAPNGTARNNWDAALAEAAFMTGLERNADVVNMASYAPLFSNIDAWQWAPDLIWVNNLQVCATPNYYVQKMYSVNKGTNVVPILLNDEPVTGQLGQDSLYATACFDKTTSDVIVKIVNAGSAVINKYISVECMQQLATKATVTVLKSNDLKTFNSFENPQAIVPTTEEIAVDGSVIRAKLAGKSFSVFRIKML